MSHEAGNFSEPCCSQTLNPSLVKRTLTHIESFRITRLGENKQQVFNACSASGYYVYYVKSIVSVELGRLLKCLSSRQPGLQNETVFPNIQYIKKKTTKFVIPFNSFPKNVIKRRCSPPLILHDRHHSKWSSPLIPADILRRQRGGPENLNSTWDTAAVWSCQTCQKLLTNTTS